MNNSPTTTNSRQTTFWDFIQGHKIEIPIIQRDYAQGRKGKEILRRNFLRDLKEALDKEELLMLDFVYGDTEEGVFHPLDGQQRLTTLWLLHWYISLKAGELRNMSNVLARFSYETRISSREFCNKLSEAGSFDDFLSRGYDGIVPYITSRTWFFSAWSQDPTIQSMLRMIGRANMDTEDKNATKDNETVDCLELLFASCDKSDFVRYWSLLTSESAPIAFYHQPLEDFGLSDDLYVKMNARGKQLTAFENFKADLIGYVNKRYPDLSDPSDGLPIKLDTTWTDLFWERKSEDNRIDEIYLAFLNRYFWGQVFNSKEMSDEEWRNDPSYKYLNEDRPNDYLGLDPYKYHSGSIPKEDIEDLIAVLDNYISYCTSHGDPDFSSPWDKESDNPFEWIPTYDKDNKVSSPTQIHRVVFFAICKYFKEGEGDPESLRRWMRVVWNLVSGLDENGDPQVRNITAVKATIKRLDSLKSHNVLASLSGQENANGSADLEGRWAEEINKARQIIDDHGQFRPYSGSARQDNGNRFTTWEDIIIDTERRDFYRGSIRCLFTNESGDIDWNDFDTKWSNAQAYFPKRIEDQSDAHMMRVLLSHFSAWDDAVGALWDHAILNNKPHAWRYILCSHAFANPVHRLLMGYDQVVSKSEPNLSQPDADINEINLWQLTQTDLLNAIFDKGALDLRMKNLHGHRALYARYHFDSGIILDDHMRDDFLRHDKDVSLEDKYKCGDSYLWGADIPFEYKGEHYVYDRKGIIYKMQTSDPSKREVRDLGNGQTEDVWKELIRKDDDAYELQDR